MGACQQAGLALGLQPVALEKWQSGYLPGTTCDEQSGHDVNDPGFMGPQTERYARSQTPYGADAGFTRAGLVEAAHDPDNPNKVGASEFLRDFMADERRARAVLGVFRVGTMVPNVGNSSFTTVYTPDERAWRFHNPDPAALHTFLTEHGYREVGVGELSPIEARIADEPTVSQLAATIQDVRRISSEVVG